MKKILALILAALMLLSLGTAFAESAGGENWNAPLAEGQDPSKWDTGEETSFKFMKIYTSNGDGKTFPAEQLKFDIKTVEGHTNPGSEMISIGTDNTNTYTVTGLENEIIVTVPVYHKVGLYKYTITEIDGTTQGVEYNKPTKTVIEVSALVTYNYKDNKLDVVCGVDADEKGNKKDEVYNIYDFGGDENNGTESLKVTKTVTGNLGDKDKYFDIDVELTATGAVLSDIAISGGSFTGNPTTIAQKDWVVDTSSESYKATVTKTLSLKDGETIKFDRIPAGITYKVVEQEKHHKPEDQNDPNSPEGYKESYTGQTGTITKGQKPTAAVTNDKNTTINTGISLETLPYIVVIALVLAGAALLIIRRRRHSDD